MGWDASILISILGKSSKIDRYSLSGLKVNQTIQTIQVTWVTFWWVKQSHLQSKSSECDHRPHLHNLIDHMHIRIWGKLLKLMQV